MIVVTPGQGVPILQNTAAPYGATAVAGASGNRLPSGVEREAAVALGERVAHLAICLRLGCTEWERRHSPEQSAELSQRFSPQD